jgi:hypothetical protein
MDGIEIRPAADELAAGLNCRCGGPQRLPYTSKLAAHGHPHR